MQDGIPATLLCISPYVFSHSLQLFMFFVYASFLFHLFSSSRDIFSYFYSQNVSQIFHNFVQFKLLSGIEMRDNMQQRKERS